MKNFALKSITIAILLNACGKAPAEAVKVPDLVEVVETQVVNVAPADVAPPQERMNFLVGRAVVTLKAIPSQIGEECKDLADVRGFAPLCRPGINATAKSANFVVDSCDVIGGASVKKPAFKDAVTCSGTIQTEIGLGQASAIFILRDGKWLLRKNDLTLTSWTPE